MPKKEKRHSTIASDKKSAADAMSDWPLAISADPNDPYPPVGPNVGDKTEIVISGLKKGNKITSFTVKNYSPKIVKIYKKKKNSSGASFWVKGLKKGKALRMQGFQNVDEVRRKLRAFLMKRQRKVFEFSSTKICPLFVPFVMI